MMREAYLLAAQKAGGGGDDGVVNYLAEKAQTHPAAFLSGLARLIPLEVNMRGNGNITIKIVKSADEMGTSQPEMKVINGHVNGHGNGSANGSGDRTSE